VVAASAASRPAPAVASQAATSASPVPMIELAPEGQEPELNSSFGGGSTPMWNNIRRSRSGYPVVVVTKSAPICSTPWMVKEAQDAWLAGDTQWLRRIAGCHMLPEGVRLEWTKLSINLGDGWVREFRMVAADGGRLTVYGPSTTIGSENSWFGWYGR
jgi:hypothetical protein